MQFLCWHLNFNASAEIISLFKLICYSSPSCWHSVIADIKNALLLLKFKFTNQSKADNNTCNGLLK
jgi:hypothetical protein